MKIFCIKLLKKTTIILGCTVNQTEILQKKMLSLELFGSDYSLLRQKL
jgi:hypothetical protein